MLSIKDHNLTKVKKCRCKSTDEKRCSCSKQAEAEASCYACTCIS